LKILTSGLLGEQYVGIEAGAEADNLVEGDTISQTQSAVVLENLISQFLYSKAADGPSSGASK
jgi:phospholipid/cholesterol/gamma-HCH transport system substrate-binding protein